VTTPVEQLITEGRAALRAGDAAGARAVFEHAFAESASGDVIEGLARASYLDLDYLQAIEEWEQAYAAHRDGGDLTSAVRVARMLAYMHGTVVGDRAVMSGWLARARTLLGDEIESLDGGWVSLDSARFDCDLVAQEQRFRATLAVARRFGDADLECVTLAYLGASLVRADRTDAGMVLLDEALAAVTGGEVDDFIAAQEVFCQLFAACEHAHDVARADQWIRIGEAIAERGRLPAVAAFCHTHYGAILTAAGRWPEADVALTDAVRLWGLGHRFLGGGALVRLAALRVRQGRFEEAEQLLDGLDAVPGAASPLATIHLARGHASLAREALERALDAVDPLNTQAAPLFALLVDAHIAANLLEEAASAAEQLSTCATLHPTDYLSAAAALARGQVCRASGTGDPRSWLHEALAGFARAQMPMELAQARLELANALVAERPDSAIAEARAALATFEGLQAARHADAAAALLRSLGVRVSTAAARRGDGALTKREAEVLDLLGHGLSNPEISDRLYVSRKTAEHHVGNILAKLGLRSRAEAAAYAVRSKPAEK
jgi:DNA-binding NarL/FixJ family response regulator